MKKTISNTLVISLLLIKVGALYSRSLIRPLLPPMVKPAVLPRICYIQRVPVYIPVPVESMAPVRRTSQTIVSRGRFSNQLPKLAARKNSQSKVEQKNPVQPNIYTTPKPPSNKTRTEQKRVEGEDEDTEAVTDTKLSTKMKEDMVVHGDIYNDDDDDDNLGYANYNQEMKKYVKDLSYINDNAKELGGYELIPVAKNIDNGKDRSRGDSADYDSVPQQSYRMINGLPNAKTQRFLSNIMSVNDNNDDDNGEDDSNENADSSINKYNSDDSDTSGVDDSEGDRTEIDRFVEQGDDKSDSVEESGDKSDNEGEGDDKNERVDEGDDKNDSVEEGDDKSEGVKEDDDEDDKEGEGDDKSDSIDEGKGKSDSEKSGNDKSDSIAEGDDKNDSIEKGDDDSESVEKSKKNSDSTESDDDKFDSEEERNDKSVSAKNNKRESLEEDDNKSDSVEEDDDKSDSVERRDTNNTTDDDDSKSDSMEKGYGISNSVVEDGDQANNVERGGDKSYDISKSEEGGDNKNDSVEDVEYGSDSMEEGDNETEEKRNMQGRDYNQMVPTYLSKSDSHNLFGVNNHNKMISNWLSGHFQPIGNNPLGVNKLINILRPQLNRGNIDTDDMDMDDVEIRTLKRPVINILGLSPYRGIVLGNDKNKQMDQNAGSSRNGESSANNGAFDDSAKGKASNDNDQNVDSGGNDVNRDVLLGDQKESMQSQSREDSRNNGPDEKHDNNNIIVQTFGVSQDKLKNYSENDIKGNDERDDVTHDDSKIDDNGYSTNSRDNVKIDNSIDDMKENIKSNATTNSFNDSVNSKENMKGDSLSKQYANSENLPTSIQLTRFQFEELMNALNTKMNSIPRRIQDDMGENERADEMNYSATNYLGYNFDRYSDMYNGEGFDLDLSYDQRKPDTKVNNTGSSSALKSSPTAFMDIKNKNMKTIGISYILPSYQSKNTNTHERYDTAVKLRAKGMDVRRERKIPNVTKLRRTLLTSTAPTVVEIPDVKPTQFIYRTTSAVNVLPSVPTNRMMRYSTGHDKRLGLRSPLDDRYYPYSG